ncbi:MarR family winged helix-turn-helix transcriptional regulator [Arthrobacter psychrochitiniphilus]|uniref:MarR family transcriptional regulator n=1 Tax=Arthrobacter psychrochitiniphilus TaxID=291045 RepID=A0A2V3DRU3_9MICC|nr:MarR family winged helix-turn-helix transcriptional regulator [Arthrobacter psychrochitiniphilus]NYG19137.1 DNA-binding MarR family transcriptional regulator [Arthrobacter psychrochitiniphilus]PXA65907.1 MarR family transcriptional regulator [Arthrobacter psychrochitiniphilus]
MRIVRHEEKVLEQLEYELMLLARHALRPYHRHEEVLDRSAMVLLSWLENVTPMTLKELAAALRLDASTVHRQVAALLRTELLAYAPNTSGEVARRVTPTPAGIAAMKATRTIHAQGIERVMEEWPVARRAQFLAGLQEFNSDVERLEGSPWPRGAVTS